MEEERSISWPNFCNNWLPVSITQVFLHIHSMVWDHIEICQRMWNLGLEKVVPRLILQQQFQLQLLRNSAPFHFLHFLVALLMPRWNLQVNSPIGITRLLHICAKIQESNLSIIWNFYKNLCYKDRKILITQTKQILKWNWSGHNNYIISKRWNRNFKSLLL